LEIKKPPFGVAFFRPRRTEISPDSERCCLNQDEIVAVNQFRAVDIPKEGFDVLRAVTGYAA
jgi:hypothetical protein